MIKKIVIFVTILLFIILVGISESRFKMIGYSFFNSGRYGTGESALLNESGDNLLLEDNYKLLME